ncbi:DUF4225 domain-containing protein [Erwinia psidii]|uniref:DUF4225 domain-containing protein n=1 Tax=Erwinia psidii TaxID=69224 RepID=UPI00226B929E|nr:DUF4225 domain-containing protein [Erwinia psidii]MCX8962535.1 DUF4225 domain-containing protein [Erwinia psidii]
MDNYLAKKRFSDYYLTMASLEARKLMSTTERVGFRHLRSITVRNDFKINVQEFISNQLKMIRTARNESQCQESVSNLQLERKYLDEQDRQLNHKGAKIVATAELKQENGVWGYIINGVGVAIYGIQVVVGGSLLAASIASGNIIGIAFSGMLTLHGMNAFQKSMENIKSGNDNFVGFLENGYIYTAKLLGFDEKTGRLAYSYIDLFLSGYGMSRLVLKPEAWRLFHYLRADCVRNIKNMSRTSLIIEMGSDAMTIKSIYDENQK